jgi:hypothetical protein
MATADAYTKSSPPHTNGDVTTACAVCAHAWTDHDTIAARFCKATIAGGFNRGCVCSALPAVTPPGGTG